MDDLDREIEWANVDYDCSAAHHAHDAYRLVALLTERIARAVRSADAYPEATEIGVDSGHHLDVVRGDEATLAEFGTDEVFTVVAGQVRDDLLGIGRTGYFTDGVRVLRLPHRTVSPDLAPDMT